MHVAYDYIRVQLPIYMGGRAAISRLKRAKRTHCQPNIHAHDQF